MASLFVYSAYTIHSAQYKEKTIAATELCPSTLYYLSMVGGEDVPGSNQGQNL